MSMDSILVSNPRNYNNSTQNIPNDIIIDILTKLPVKSLLRLKGICRSWYSLIKDEKFVKQHHDTHKNRQKYFIISRGHEIFHHYTMDVPQVVDSTRIVSLIEPPIRIDQSLKVYPNIQYFSSNGILFITYSHDIIVMWNPSTRESRRIPSPIYNNRGSMYSFCYFHYIDDYKIFRLRCGDNKEIDIFSTKSNMWKSIGMFPSNYYFLGFNVVMVDGIVYMMARNKENLPSVTILRFCLEKEKFEDELLFPYVVPWTRHVLHSLGEKLCLIRILDDNREFWLYTMEKNSWNKILTIPLALKNGLKPVSFTEDGSMMFQSFDRRGFVAYNSTLHKFEQVNVGGIKGLYFNKVVTYEETLSSLNP
ncbi:F-box protein CPR1-like [Solanum lycopersicum]|uniref:F-box protein CPR1-like n=1 Tax=Solanum lycopersicum TaxID=4081 RepID=UPI003749DBED